MPQSEIREADFKIAGGGELASTGSLHAETDAFRASASRANRFHP
jgi:hypothetical protein